MDIFYHRIHNVINRYGSLILTNPNIIGIARCLKIINGFTTDIPCLTVFVKEKLPKDTLSSNNVIPKFINGSVTDVLECNKVKQYYDYTRPAVSGLSISVDSPYGIIDGTLGYAVTDLNKKNIYILTSCHALTKSGSLSELVTKQYVYQPSLTNGGNSSNRDHKIGYIQKVIPLKCVFRPTTNQPLPPLSPEEYNEVDAGLIFVATINGNLRNNLRLGKLPKSQYISGTKNPKEDSLKGQKIFVNCRNNELKTGEIYSEESAWKVEMDIPSPRVTEVHYTKQILCKLRCAPGDSGALGYIEDNASKKLYAVGLLWGGGEYTIKKGQGKTSTSVTEYISIFSPIDKVLEKLNVSLL